MKMRFYYGLEEKQAKMNRVSGLLYVRVDWNSRAMSNEIVHLIDL